MMARFSKALWGAAIVGLAMAVPASSKTQPLAAAPPPKIFQDVVQCRAIADAAQRLACFDRSVGALATAQANKDVYVADKDAIREARRGLFGFSLPKMKIFGDDDMGEDVDQIETTIAGVGQGQKGYIFTLKDGARWMQTDGAYMDKPEDRRDDPHQARRVGQLFREHQRQAGLPDRPYQQTDATGGDVRRTMLTAAHIQSELQRAQSLYQAGRDGEAWSAVAAAAQRDRQSWPGAAPLRADRAGRERRRCCGRRAAPDHRDRARAARDRRRAGRHARHAPAGTMKRCHFGPA